MKPDNVRRISIGLACVAGLFAPPNVFGADHVVFLSENIPCVLWTRGCTPTSASMVLGYYDRGQGPNEWYGMGRLVDYWREYTKYSDGTGPLRNAPNILEELRVGMHTTVIGATPWADISPGIENATNSRNRYDFISDSTGCYASNDWCWDAIRREIDADRPFVWSASTFDSGGLSHSLAAWGYTDAKYVITYNTWQCTARDDWDYDQYDDTWALDYGQVNTVVPGGWTRGQTSLLYPNGGETWVVGGTYTIRWYEFDDGVWYAQLFYSLDGGVSWTYFATVEPSSPGWVDYAWTVPSTWATGKARIAIANYSGAPGAWVYQSGDGSEGNFSIVMPKVAVTAPNGGELWFAGESKSIRWTSSNAGSFVKIELSRDAGTTWSPITASAPNTGSYPWTVSGPSCNVCRVRVTSTSYPPGTDTSNSNFLIGTLGVTAPNGGEIWFAGDRKNITWSSASAGPYVRIEINRDASPWWVAIASSAPNTGLFAWTVSGPPSKTCRVRITSTTYPVATDTSNAVFEIAAGISIADASIREGNTGTRTLAFPVTLSTASSQTVSVVWATVAGSAVPGRDFVAASGRVVFAPGVTKQTVNVVILGNTVPEPNETFQVALSSPVGALLRRSAATGLILNDD